MDVSKDEVARRLGEDGFVVIDVRSRSEFTGELTAPCDPRPGHIQGARHLDVQELLTSTQQQIRELVGPADVEIVTYCHSGSRSDLAAQILAAAGYLAANYRGSWHEWSRDDSLPAATGEEG